MDIHIADVKKALEAGERMVLTEERGAYVLSVWVPRKGKQELQTKWEQRKERLTFFSQAGHEGPDENQSVRPESQRVEEMVAPIEEVDEEYQERAYRNALEPFDPNVEEE